MYVDIAGWHLFMRDMNAVPGFKMSSALATKLGPEVCNGHIVGPLRRTHAYLLNGPIEGACLAVFYMPHARQSCYSYQSSQCQHAVILRTFRRHVEALDCDCCRQHAAGGQACWSLM